MSFNDVEMPLLQLRDLCNLLKRAGLFPGVIKLTGGEPLTHPDLFAIIDECRELTDDVRVNTNATLLTDETIAYLSKHKVSKLVVGIDTFFGEETNPNIPKRKMDMNVIIASVRKACEVLNVALNSVVTHFNYHHINDIIDFAAELGISQVRFLQLIPSANLSNSDETNLLYHQLHDRLKSRASSTIRNDAGSVTSFHLKTINNKNMNVVLLDDVCVHGACSHMYNEIDAKGNLVVCKLKHISNPINTADSEEFKTLLKTTNDQMCDCTIGRFTLKSL
jgi:MoaA/NifB/PqqE/SkfB family radical SAM enzyme